MTSQVPPQAQKARRKLSKIYGDDFLNAMTKVTGESDRDFDGRKEAVRLLYQAMTRLMSLYQAKHANDFYMAGVYWRLAKVLEFTDSRLDNSAACSNPEKIRREAYPKLPSDSRWISVDEELPESFDMVLVTIEYKNQAGATCKIVDYDCFGDGEWSLCSKEYAITNGHVTHWQPLPLPAQHKGVNREKMS